MYYSYLREKGLDESSAKQISVQLDLWERSCGLEWTCARLKLIKDWYINRLSGISTTPLPYVAFRKDGTLKGPIRQIFLLKKPRKVIDALMVYTTMRIKGKPTQSQKKKFFSSVEAPDVNVPHIPFLKECIDDLPFIEFNDGLTYHWYPFSGTKRAPVSDLSKSQKNLPGALIEDFRSSCIWNFLDDDTCEFVISGVLDNLYPMLRKEVPEEVQDDRVGRISVIQERGCKARFIALPRLTLQLGTLPLGDYLFRLLKLLPWDCTHNQKSGVDWCKNQFKSGKKIWSVDLSDATNHLPLKLIDRVLRAIDNIPYHHREYFNKLSRGVWKSDHLGGPSELVWTKGQPLGLYPSFAAFALTHGLILRSIERRYNLSDTFRVLGDDVIISHEMVHWSYRKLLELMYIPVSESKTLVKSSKLAEFAGYYISPKRSFRPAKYIIPSEDNFLERRGRSIRSLTDIKDPYDLIALANLPENRLGLTLMTLSALKRLTDVEQKFTQLTFSLGRDTFNKLKYDLMDRFGLLNGGLMKRELFDQFNVVIEQARRFYTNFTSSKDKCVLHSICDCLGITDVLIPEPYPTYKEVSWHFGDSLIGVITRVRTLKLKEPSMYSRYRNAIRRQLRDFEKSKSVIEYEVLSKMIEILEA